MNPFDLYLMSLKKTKQYRKSLDDVAAFNSGKYHKHFSRLVEFSDEHDIQPKEFLRFLIRDKVPMGKWGRLDFDLLYKFDTSMHRADDPTTQAIRTKRAIQAWMGSNHRTLDDFFKFLTPATLTLLLKEKAIRPIPCILHPTLSAIFDRTDHEYLFDVQTMMEKVQLTKEDVISVNKIMQTV